MWLEDTVNGDDNPYVLADVYRDIKWWYDIVEGLPDPIVQNSMIEVWDAPGLGVEFNVDKAQQYLEEEDKDFFD
jgi:L-alanine-DL-glutamate epimerase-like enolase superfamily enzyme